MELNPTHSGFAHGFGIFETIRVSDGRIEFWEAHFERLVRSAQALNLNFDLKQEILLDEIREWAQAESLRDGILKVSLISEGNTSRCYVYSRLLINPEGMIHLKLETQTTLNPHSILAGHKTHNYMESMHLLKSARAEGFSDVVRVNTAGFIAETAISNLFFIRGDRLHTPALSTGILPGIIRAEILAAAERCSIASEEGNYTVNQLSAAEALFLTNSSIGLLPVDELDVDGRTVSFKETHPMLDGLGIELDRVRKQKSVKL